MFKVFMAVGALIAGLVIAAYQLYQGHLIYVIFYILCGLAVGWACLSDTPEVFFDSWYVVASSIIGAIGISGVLYYSNATKSDLQHGYAAALMGMATLTETCHPMSPELSKLAERGVMACSGQNIRDLSDLTFDLQKGVHLGPGLSLADGAHDLSKDLNVNNCARLFKIAARLCPYSFPNVDTSTRVVLLKAAE